MPPKGLFGPLELSLSSRVYIHVYSGLTGHGCDLLLLPSFTLWTLSFPLLLVACLFVSKVRARVASTRCDKAKTKMADLPRMLWWSNGGWDCFQLFCRRFEQAINFLRTKQFRCLVRLVGKFLLILLRLVGFLITPGGGHFGTLDLTCLSSWKVSHFPVFEPFIFML